MSKRKSLKPPILPIVTVLMTIAGTLSDADAAYSDSTPSMELGAAPLSVAAPGRVTFTLGR